VGRLPVLLATTVLALGAADAAATRTVTIHSHVSIVSHGLAFSGHVTASNAACVVHRHVTLYRTNGNVLGHTTTSTHGYWKITAQGSAGISLGHFYARVSRRSEGAAGTIYVCTAARSRTIPMH
jgi:hypothetical protein